MLAFRARSLQFCVSGAGLKIGDVRCGFQTSLLRKKLGVVSSLQIVCCCTGGGVYGRIEPQLLLLISYEDFLFACCVGVTKLDFGFFPEEMALYIAKD